MKSYDMLVERLRGDVETLKQQLLNSAATYDSMEATAEYWKAQYEKAILATHNDAHEMAANTRKAYNMAQNYPQDYMINEAVQATLDRENLASRVKAEKNQAYINEALHGNTDEWDEWIAADDGELEPDTKSDIARKWAEKHGVKHSETGELERRISVAENMLRVVNGDREGISDQLIALNKSLTEVYQRYVDVSNNVEQLRTQMFNHHNEQQKGIRALDEKIIGSIEGVKEYVEKYREVAVKTHHAVGKVDHEVGSLNDRFNRYVYENKARAKRKTAKK